MARDIKKEKEWAKAKYTRILGDIDKELGDELKEKLKKIWLFYLFLCRIMIKYVQKILVYV